MQFSREEEESIIQAIRHAESMTSGEIRLYIESVCESGNPLERAKQLFLRYEMHKTRERNGVMLYIATISRQFAIYGDEAIFQKCGQNFWDEEKLLLRRFLQADEPAAGICAVVESIGHALKYHFPADENDNPNELPDDIIYG